MINRQNPVPLYHQIKEMLLNQIQAMEPHAGIESELLLANKYQVSRGTVKQAIQDLVKEGYLYRIQGKGTFVTAPRILRSFTQLPSFSEDIRRRGYTPGVRLLELTKIVPTAKMASALQLASGANVWKIERVRLADNQPIAVVASYLPFLALEGLTEDDVKGSLYEMLDHRYKMRPAWAHDTYTAINANLKVAHLLSVPKGTAVIYSERTAYLPNNQPIEFVESFIRGDRFVIHIDINGGGDGQQHAG